VLWGLSDVVFGGRLPGEVGGAAVARGFAGGAGGVGGAELTAPCGCGWGLAQLLEHFAKADTFQLKWVSPSLSSALPVVVTTADVMIGNGVRLDRLL